MGSRDRQCGLFGRCATAVLVFALLGLAPGALHPPRLAAKDKLVEQLAVDSARVSPTCATTPLKGRAKYRIDVSGVYLFNNFPGLGHRQADAEYNSEDSFQTHADQGSTYDLLVVYGSSIGTPIHNSQQNITAQDVDWGPFSPGHEYSLNVRGGGGEICFVVSDFWGDDGNCQFCQNQGTFDNSGLLDVKIFKAT